MSTIKKLKGLEILDSRGRPTVRAWCELGSGAVGVASVPSGASTGTAEALEMRDGDRRRYRGLGCRKAVQNINGALNQALAGQSFDHQESLDRALLGLDGTANKSRLGANALLAVSLAFARAAAADRGVPLYDYFARIMGTAPVHLPRPTINLFSGGKHAGAQVPIQDVLVLPLSPVTMDEALAMTFEVYQSASELIHRKYGMRALKADEGGLAPAFASVEGMFDDALEAFRAAGLTPGKDVALAVDVASSHFYNGGSYELGGQRLESAAMIEQLTRWLGDYPILSLEDGLAEDDWQAWPALCARAGNRVLILGDDLLCTNTARIQRAIDLRAANALLLKVNQVGTLTEAAEACWRARGAGWSVTVSARSGETEDDWLADLAVGWAGDQIKVGSIAQSERLAKYNRLLEIEAATNLPLAPWPKAFA
jgi:enolase